MIRGFSEVVFQCHADLADRRVYGVLEFDEFSVFPKLVVDFVAGDQFSMTVRQERQQASRLILKLDPTARLAQFTGLKVQLKRFEAYSILHADQRRSYNLRNVHLPTEVTCVLPASYLLCIEPLP